MGKDKAFLEYNGRSLLDIQLEKLCRLDVAEIFISGDPAIYGPHIGTRTFSGSIQAAGDLIPGKGPLGGIMSCMHRSSCSCALVIGTDIPLIRYETLDILLKSHLESSDDATVLSHGSSIEPLIAVYNTDLLPVISDLVRSSRLSVRSLLERINVGTFDFCGPADELFNCNTAGDYKDLIEHSASSVS